MKAVVFQTKDQPLIVKNRNIPAPGEGEVLVKMSYASINHLDLWIWKEQDLAAPVISGSDGSGVVTEVGKGIDPALVGREVIINPSLYWGPDEKMFGDRYEILGNPTNGTFAEYMVIPAEYVYEKPAHLTLREAAALPMAALTAYRALFTKAQLRSSDTVLITGIGGGAALYLFQMAIAAGARVFVTSSSNEKISRAIAAGAQGGFNYKDAAWVEQAKKEAGGFDVVIDSAGGDGFAQLTELANAGARIVLFGRTAGNINNLKPGIIFNKQLQISGTVMGTQREFADMLSFYEKHQLHPVIDREFLLDEISEAFKYMNEGNHFGKLLLRMP